MKRYAFFILLLLTACKGHNFKNDFNGSQEQLNTWSSRATIQNLCDGLFTYQDDSYIVNRILFEFNRRNVSYLNCRQYKGSK